MTSLLLAKELFFSSTHRYWRDDWTEDQNRERFGRCVNVHGHDYAVHISLAGEPDPATGMIVNLTDVKQAAQPILAELDGHHLNDTAAFLDKVPTTEHIALHLADTLGRALPPGVFHGVRVAEEPDLWATVGPDGLRVGRAWRFTAATAKGEGHNFRLCAEVVGRLDPETGMACDLAALDAAGYEVVGPLDHAFLPDRPGWEDAAAGPGSLLAVAADRLVPMLSGDLASLVLEAGQGRTWTWRPAR